MRPGQIRIRLKPQCNGAFTRWRLSGSTVTTAPAAHVRYVLEQLSFWSGLPVELVLPAEGGSDEWFDWWTDAVAPLPARHLEIRFALPRRTRAGHES